MKRRTLEQLKVSKVIYRKHANQYKALDYPLHRCKRMMILYRH